MVRVFLLYWLEPTSSKPSDLTVDSNVTRSLLQSKVIPGSLLPKSVLCCPRPVPTGVQVNWQTAGLLIRKLQVRILPPQLSIFENRFYAGDWSVGATPVPI